MHKNELIGIFESALESSGITEKSIFIEKLDRKLEGKKYDIQDCSLIEIIINEDREDFEESFSELIKSRFSGGNNTLSEKSIEETVNLFIQSLEHSIDYYYNNIIARHFSST